MDQFPCHPHTINMMKKVLIIFNIYDKVLFICSISTIDNFDILEMKVISIFLLPISLDYSR